LQEENEIQRQITGKTRSRIGELAAAVIQTGFLTTEHPEPEKTRSIKAARQSSANPNIYFPQLILELANPNIYFAQSTLATINPRIQNKSKWRGVWIYLLLGPCLFHAYDQAAYPLNTV